MWCYRHVIILWELIQASGLPYLKGNCGIGGVPEVREKDCLVYPPFLKLKSVLFVLRVFTEDFSKILCFSNYYKNA